MRSRIAAAAIGAVLLLGACTANESAPAQSPSSPATPEAPIEVVPAPPLSAEELSTYSGVATLAAAASCTGTLIETGVDSAPAYLLTNGHCVGLDGWPPNSTISDGEGEGEGEGEAKFFNVLDADESSVRIVPIAGYEFGTMRGQDIGIVRLDATLGELRAAGANPLPIADATPEAGTEVVNIASPTEGIDENEQVLRKGACALGEPVDVVESTWLWFDAPRADCPGVLGGSSGSPLIADGVIASVLNTTNGGVAADRGVTCYRGMPCEVVDGAAVFVPNSSYGVNVAGIGQCFVDGTFTLGGSCPLVPLNWDGVDGGGTFGGDGTDGFENGPEVSFAGAMPGEYAVSPVLPIGDLRTCADPAAYADGTQVTVEEGAEPEPVPVTLPTENGFALVCVAVPGKEAEAARFVYAIDTIAPTAGPELALRDLGEDGILVDPVFDVPEISNVEVLFGPVAKTDCANRAAYETYRRQSFMIEPGDQPVRFCAVGFDMAGNESPVTEEIIGSD